MTPLPKRTLEWMLKAKYYGTKTFPEPKFFLFIVKLKKLGFSALLVFLTGISEERLVGSSTLSEDI